MIDGAGGKRDAVIGSADESLSILMSHLFSLARESYRSNLLSSLFSREISTRGFQILDFYNAHFKSLETIIYFKAFRMLLPRLCQPILQRNLLLQPKAMNRIFLYRNASAWTRMRQFLKQHGSVFIVVKMVSFTPLMLLCYKIPSAFGYDGISEFILAQGKNKSIMSITNQQESSKCNYNFQNG